MVVGVLSAKLRNQDKPHVAFLSWTKYLEAIKRYDVL
jgi:hypothetical protein